MVDKKAEAEKNKANAAFKAGKYDEALEAYTKAIELDNTNAVYPANRANIYIKKKDWAAAVEDCTSAIKIDEKKTNVSA